MRIYKNSHLPITQSNPDSQTHPHQNHSTGRSCNAAQFHGRNTGFAGGRVGKRYPLPWFPLSDGPNRYSCQTKPGCRLYQSSHAGCRFGRSGNSGFVGGFLRLRWSSCVPVPAVHRNLDQCRYRYICRPVGFPARGGPIRWAI